MKGATARTLGGTVHVIDRIAIGGMAEIYLARMEGAHGIARQVVVKRILPKFCDDPSFLRMFREEARIAASLQHANIAQVYDFGESDGRPFFTMEYVEGHDLRAIGSKCGRAGVPLEVSLGIVIGLAAALHYAHGRKDASGTPLHIVHRDVSPSNVFLTFDGVPKLLDFGVAKASTQGREETRIGVLKGKFAYMSPEQTRQVSDLDGRSDIFSLGTLLWELTTRRGLFRGSPAEIIHKIGDTDAPRPSTRVPDYPPELERIVMKALARDRNCRYASAREMQMDLESFALRNQLLTSATRLSAFMHENFREELLEEERALALQKRHKTDSQVMAASQLPTRADDTEPEVEPEPDTVTAPTNAIPSKLPRGKSETIPVLRPDRPGEIRLTEQPLTARSTQPSDFDELATLTFMGSQPPVPGAELAAMEADLQSHGRSDAPRWMPEQLWTQLPTWAQLPTWGYAAVAVSVIGLLVLAVLLLTGA